MAHGVAYCILAFMFLVDEGFWINLDTDNNTIVVPDQYLSRRATTAEISGVYRCVVTSDSGEQLETHRSLVNVWSKFPLLRVLTCTYVYV